MAKRTSLSIKDIIPYLGPYLIFLGVVRLIIYYRFFNINIVSFLEFTEILTSFFDILITVALIGIAFLLLSRLGGQTEEEWKQKQIHSIWNEPLLKQRLRKYLGYLSPDIFLGVFFLVVMFIGSFFRPVYKGFVLEMTLYYFALLALRVVAMEIRIKQQDSDEREKMFNSAFIGIAFSIGIISFFTYTEVRSVKDDNKYIGTRIELSDNSTIHSNEHYYFIGKTNNYVFIHSELRNETEVVPMSRINSITFPKKPPSSN